MFRKLKSQPNKKKENINWENIYGKINDITKDEICCQSCGFSARYMFVRCPECSVLRK